MKDHFPRFIFFTCLVVLYLIQIYYWIFGDVTYTVEQRTAMTGLAILELGVLVAIGNLIDWGEL